MFSDGIVDLVEAGVVTNRYKRVHPGRIATSFVTGQAPLRIRPRQPFCRVLSMRSHQRTDLIGVVLQGKNFRGCV